MTFQLCHNRQCWNGGTEQTESGQIGHNVGKMSMVSETTSIIGASNSIEFTGILKRARRDLNARPLAPEANALSS
jgi:hypothetical protein